MIRRWCVVIETAGGYDTLISRYRTKARAWEVAEQANLLLPRPIEGGFLAFIGRKPEARFQVVTERTLWNMQIWRSEQAGRNDEEDTSA